LAGRDDVALKEELDLLLKSPGGLLLEFEARVMRVTPGKGAALEVYGRDEKKPKNWRKKALEEVTLPLPPEPLDDGRTVKEFGGGAEFDSGLHAALQVDTSDKTAPDLGLPPETEPHLDAGLDPAAEESEPGAPPVAADVLWAQGSASDVAATNTLFQRIQHLSVNEKQKLAMIADRPERMVLARDNLKQVHAFVLKNPKVQDDEVAEYVRFAGLSPQALGIIADNSRWMRSPQLRFDLVKNPQVPADVARRVIETLSVNEVRFLAKADNVKHDVRQAARKYLERKGMM
jgi:hypothetical protein